MNQNTNDYIKTFLKIEKTEENSHSIFSLDKNHQIFSFYSLDNKKLDFEYDKIFIDKDENSYIYEIISENCLQECIKGINYCFISFGETVNKKFETLVGDVKENDITINDYGILIRFLNDLLIKIKEKEGSYTLKFSNFMIYENNLIDLTILGDKNKKGYKVDSNILLSNSLKINNDLHIINKMSKINLYKFNDILKYLHYIHKFLSKLNEEKIYNKSNICFIIYLFDALSNKIISTVSFIILLGSENLYGKSKMIVNNGVNKLNNSKSIKSAKSSIEARYIFNSVINCISNNININQSNNKLKINEDFESKLTTVLYNICFDKNISNIKFRIIGNIKPTKGYYQNIKDVLIFLFDCWKILNNKKEEKKEINYGNITNKENAKFEMEFIIKSQKYEIDNLNRKIEKLNKKIEFLECNYQKQITTIKNCFEFNGDINVLLSGNENTKEMKYVKEYKNFRKIIRDYQASKKNLEKNLEESQNEIEMLKTKLNSRKMQQDMINYYLAAQNSNINSKKNSEDNSKFNALNKQIEELTQKIKSKDKIIEILQKELEKKSKIIFNTTNSKIKDESKNISKINSENKEKKMSEFSFRQELENMKLKEENDLVEIKKYYYAMLFEKKEEIYELKQKHEEIINENNKIKTELINIYEILMNLVTYIETNRKDFNKSTEELEKIILEINDNINNKHYPNLFMELKEKKESKNELKETNGEETLKDSEIKNGEEKDINLNLNQEMNKANERAKDRIIEELKEKNKLLSFTFDLQIKKNNNNLIIINSQKRTIEKLEREINIYKQFLPKGKILTIDNLENKKIKTSFSFNNNAILKIQKPHIIKRNKRINDIYNYDSLKQKTKNNTNFNNFNSYQNTNDKNNLNNKDMKELLLIQKRIKKITKNKRPLSVSNEMKNITNFITN